MQPKLRFSECGDCGVSIEIKPGPGRPRTRCADCAQRALLAAGRSGWRHNLGPDNAGDIAGLLGSYEQHLRALKRSPRTIERYLLVARQLSEFLVARDLSTDVQQIRRGDIEKFNVMSIETTASTTANGRHNALAQFFKFVKIHLADEDISYRNPMSGLVAPTFVEPVIAAAPPATVTAMLATMRKGRAFEDVRDYAITACFIDTGGRLEEITGMNVTDLLDVDLVRLIGKSKGRGPVERHVPFGETAAAALRRYLRQRAQHPRAAGTDRLWLGRKGPMTGSGIRQMIWKRSAAEGLRLHPHQFRHAFADAWLAGDGSEGDLMRLTGWRTRAMVDRYGADQATKRAHAAYRKNASPLDKLT